MQISILMMTAFPESAAVTIDMNFQKRQSVFADLGELWFYDPTSQSDTNTYFIFAMRKPIKSLTML